MNRRSVYWVVIVSILMLLVANFYGQVVFAVYGNGVPSSWNADLYALTHKDLVLRLGPPDADLAVKGFQHWEKKEWWGTYELQIGYADCCADRSMASSVYVAAYVKGKYDPVLFKKIPRLN